MALRIVSLEEIEKLITFIRQNYTTLKDDNDREDFKGVLEHIETAKTMADDDRRRMCLFDAATKFANQLAFRLFVEDNLSDETLEIFRKFDSARTVSEAAQEYTKALRAREDEITQIQQDFVAELRPFEVFQAVINGMSKEEAERKQAEYIERQRQALASRG